MTLDGTGKLAVSRWTSLTNGTLTITGGDYAPTAGAVTADNSFANLADIDGSGLYVSGGGSLSLPAVTSYTDNDNDKAFQVIDTTSGGVLSLPKLATIGGAYAAQIQAAGAASQIDLPMLTSFSATYLGEAVLSVTQGATVEDGVLTSLTGVAVTLDGTGKLAVNQWTALTNGSLNVTEGDYAPTAGAATADNSFANLADIDGSGLYVSGGGSLSLPAVTSYTDNNNEKAFQVTNTTAGGILSLPNLTTITGNYGAQIVAAGAASEIDLPRLTSFSAIYSGTALLSVTQSATVVAGDLATLNAVAVTLDGTGTLAVGQWTTLTDSSLTITGGDYADNTFTNLADIDGSSIYVYGGGSLVLPAVITDTNNNGYESLQAYQPNAYYGQTPTVGVISLPDLTTIGGNYGLEIQAAGSSSEIDLPQLTSFSATYSDAASLKVTQGATVEDGALTTLNNVAVTLDGTGTLAVNQWTALTNGSLTVTAGDYAPTAGAATADNSFANLADIDGSGIYVYGGGSLTLPVVTTYTNNNYSYEFLQADQFTFYDYTNGTYYGSGSVGVLSLPALTTISGQYVFVLAGGTGSEIDLPVLTSINLIGSGGLSVTNGATVHDGSLTTLNGVTVSIDGSATLDTSPWATFTNSHMDVTGGSYTFNLLTHLDGSSIDLGGGATVTLTALTSYSNPNGYDTTSLQASGGGTVLSLPELTSLGTDNSILDIQALQGGQVLLPLLGAITDASPYVEIESDGTSGTGGSGSLIDLSSLASFAGNGYYASLQITDGASVIDPNLTSFTDVNLTLDPTVTFPLTPSENFTVTTGASISVTTGTLVEQGSLTIPDRAAVTLNGSLEVNGSGVLVLTPAAALNISGNLTGSTTNADRFTPLGTVLFDNTSAAQQLEAMSADLGSEQAGFVNNFAYGTISLASGTYLQLVDNAHNSSGTGAEAVYANGLIVPSAPRSTSTACTCTSAGR